MALDLLIESSLDVPAHPSRSGTPSNISQSSSLPTPPSPEMPSPGIPSPSYCMLSLRRRFEIVGLPINPSTHTVDLALAANEGFVLFQEDDSFAEMSLRAMKNWSLEAL